MSFNYFDKGDVRIKGTSNGYVVIQVTDELDQETASVDVASPEFFRELAIACNKAADDLELNIEDR